MSAKKEKIIMVRERGQITLPFKMREKLGIEENSLLGIKVSRGKIILTPVNVDERTEPNQERTGSKNRRQPKKIDERNRKKTGKKEPAEDDKQKGLFMKGEDSQ